MKKFVLLLVAIMLMASCLMVVHAEEATPIQSVSVVYKNPHYDGQVRQVVPRSDSIYASDTYYWNTRECGEFLREGMKQRYETIAVNYIVYNFDENNAEQMASEIGAEMMGYAFEHTGKPAEGDYLSWQYGGYMLYLDGFAEGNKYYLTFIFVNAYFTTAQEEAQTDAAVQKLLPKLTGESEYDKIKAVYDWVTTNVTCVPMTEESKLQDFTAYGALVNKSANSLGIANLVYRLLLELGIDNRIIYGTHNGTEQFWNIVLLEQEYYNLNASLDCGNSEYQYFLRCDANFGHVWDPIFDQYHNVYPMDDDDYVPGTIKVLGSGYYGMEENVDEVYWKYTVDNVLTIYGTGRMTDNVFNSDYWGKWKNQITQVVIEEGITYVGQGAFSYHQKVTSLVLPESLVAIGDYAFDGCQSLTELTLPNNLKEIGLHAFSSCDGFQEITLPEGLEKIDRDAFSYCKNLKEVYLPESLTELGNSAFSQCSSLEFIYLPDSLKVLGNFVLDGCYALTEVDLPDNLEQIGMRAFMGTQLKSIEIPDTVTFIGSEAFSYCPLTEVVIPDSVTEMGEGVFWMCDKLVKVEFSDAITELPRGILYGCHALTDLILPQNLTSIGKQAFAYCHSLGSLTIPASVAQLGGWVFSGYNDPFELIFMGNPPTFSDDTFANATCTAYYPGSNPKWTEDVLQNYEGTVTWIPHDHVSIIPGDLNADGTVDDGDVALLLWHTLFPDDYGISSNADFTGDSVVDDADVAYLLWHTLFPDAYPL